jgi:hypothetical protein
MTAPLDNHIQWIIGANPAASWVDFDSYLVVTFANGTTEIVNIYDDEEDISDDGLEAEYQYHRSLGTSHDLAMERCS